MSRIILSTLGSLGDLHPLMAIGLELHRCGHDVVFASFPHYRTLVEDLGFAFHDLRPSHIMPDDHEMVARMMDIKHGTEYIVKDFICAHLRDTYDDLIQIAKGADFIVAGELVYAAQLVAEQLGIKWALCVLAPISFFSAYDLPILPPLPWLAKLRPLGLTVVNRALIYYGKFSTRLWGQPFHDLRQDLGLAKKPGNLLFDLKFSPYLTLAMFSALFAQPQPDWPPHTVMTGFTFFDGNNYSKYAELTPELQRFLEAGEPPIVFTLGSAAVMAPGQFFAESIEAAKRLNRRAVLLMGQNPPPADLPDSIFACDYVPFSQIFARASVIVHQGGIGTTAQALKAGKPTVVVPYSHDQPDNADRLERLGTSRTVGRTDYTAKHVANALTALLEDPRYAAKALEIKRLIQTEDGAKIACDQIEKHLSVNVSG
jgi:rhamnosyltransferase subunit B